MVSAGVATLKTNEFSFFKKGYLLLKRGAGQGLKIGDNVEVEVAKIENGTVYLAIKAPNQKVLRNELEGKEPRKPDGAA